MNLFIICRSRAPLRFEVEFTPFLSAIAIRFTGRFDALMKSGWKGAKAKLTFPRLLLEVPQLRKSLTVPFSGITFSEAHQLIGNAEQDFESSVVDPRAALCAFFGRVNGKTEQSNMHRFRGSQFFSAREFDAKKCV